LVKTRQKHQTLYNKNELPLYCCLEHAARQHKEHALLRPYSNALDTLIRVSYHCEVGLVTRTQHSATLYVPAYPCMFSTRRWTHCTN